MSGYLSGLVLLVGPVDRGQRSVLTAIADSADDQTGYCWPSVQTLANKTLFTTRYVIDSIAQLEEDRWMKVEHRAVKGRWTAYTVDVDKLETLRMMQKDLEKKRKRSGANVASTVYVADLRQLHESHMKLVHLRSEQSPQDSHEQSSPENSQPSGEQSSRQIDPSQVNSATSEVNCTTVSSELQRTPINIVKHQETSLKGEATPSESEDFPAGLSVQQYVAGIFENRNVVAGFTVRDLAAQAVKAISRGDTSALHEAARVFDQRVVAALDNGEEINNFWFTDGKWKGDSARRHHRSTHRDGPSVPMRVVVPTQEELDAEERSAFETWQSMNEHYKRVNPWRGRAFA